jgi:putative ABC transport system permease protein
MDDAQHPVVVIINEHLARMAWPGEDPIGKTVKLFGSEDLVEIVGVTKTVTYDNIGEEAKPFLFFSMMQEPDRGGFGTIHVRTHADAAALAPTLRKQLQSLDPTLPFVNVTTIDENIEQGLWAPRTGAALLSVFGVLALLLAAMGVYGIMSYTVSLRTREIGIRMAVGAQPSDVLHMILRRGLIVAGTGLVIGLALAFGLTRFFQNLLYGISATDPLTFGAIALVLAAIALLASWLPARKATKVNPLIALRSE